MMNYKELWGLSLDEFLHRPMHEVALLREMSEQIAKKRAAAIEVPKK